MTLEGISSSDSGMVLGFFCLCCSEALEEYLFQDDKLLILPYQYIHVMDNEHKAMAAMAT